MKTLTKILTEHRVGHIFGAPAQIGCLCGWRGTFEDHPVHVAAAYREARTITDTMHLEALPEGAIVRDDNEWVFAFNSDQWWTVLSSGVGGGEAGGECLTSAVALPALVLWLPGEAS